RPADWRQAVHWEFDFRDVTRQGPETALGIASEECTINILRGRRYKYVHFTALPPLLFDLEKDPFELENLAQRPEHLSTLLRCASELLSWRMRNGDRVLANMLLTPTGVREKGRTAPLRA